MNAGNCLTWRWIQHNSFPCKFIGVKMEVPYLTVAPAYLKKEHEQLNEFPTLEKRFTAVSFAYLFASKGWIIQRGGSIMYQHPMATPLRRASAADEERPTSAVDVKLSKSLFIQLKYPKTEQILPAFHIDNNIVLNSGPDWKARDLICDKYSSAGLLYSVFVVPRMNGNLSAQPKDSWHLGFSFMLIFKYSVVLFIWTSSSKGWKCIRSTLLNCPTKRPLPSQAFRSFSPALWNVNRMQHVSSSAEH